MFYLNVLMMGGILLLAGCASSNVSRDVTAQIDQGVQNVQNGYQYATEGNAAYTYQNTTQRTKGVFLGGAAGTVTGMSTSLGVVPGVLAGAILGASYGQYIDANTTLRDQLENRGLNMMTLGNNVRIIIPSGIIFNEMTATINPSATSTFPLLAQYINSFTTMSVMVSAYTDNLAPPRISLALSKAQAKSVANMLAVSGVNTRLLFANGYGGTQLVDDNTLVWGESDNNRVEIAFETL